MSIKPYHAMLLFLALLPGQAFCQSPNGGISPDMPIAFGSTRSIESLPPQFPTYLPNGAINLDEAWIKYGGARLYWNSVFIPRQVNLAGSAWIDPALVPQLTQDKAQPKRRYYRRSTRRLKSTAPAKASSTALKSPGKPAQAARTEGQNAASQPIPPLTAAQTQMQITGGAGITAPAQENRAITPPPLQ